jgi:hypothetical protein
MTKNKDGMLICYHETCTCVVPPVVPPVTYQEQDEEVAAHVATGTVAVGIGVPTADVASADVGVFTDGASVASDVFGVPNAVLWSLGTVTGTDKPTFAATADGIPDAAHASTIAQYQLTISSALNNVSATIAASDLHQSTITIAFAALPAVAAAITSTCAFPIKDN